MGSTHLRVGSCYVQRGRAPRKEGLGEVFLRQVDLERPRGALRSVAYPHTQRGRPWALPAVLGGAQA